MRTLNIIFGTAIIVVLLFATLPAYAPSRPTAPVPSTNTAAGPCTPTNPCSDPPSATQMGSGGFAAYEQACTYTIYNVGNGSYNANSCDTGKRAYTNTDPFGLFNTTIANAQGGTVVIRAGTYSEPATGGDIYVGVSNITLAFENGAILKTAWGTTPSWAIKNSYASGTSTLALNGYPVMLIYRANWVRVTGATFNCAGCVHPGGSTEPFIDGIWVLGSQNVFIDHNWFYNLNRFPVLAETGSLTSGGLPRPWGNVHIDDNYMVGDGSIYDGGGVKIQNGGNAANGGWGAWVEHNVISTQVGDYGVDFGGCTTCAWNTDWVSNINIMYNVITGHTGASYMNPIFGENYPTRDVNIIGNNITGGYNAIYFNVYYGYTVADNWIYSPYNMGIFPLSNSLPSGDIAHDITISNNHIFNAGQPQGAGSLHGIYIACAGGGIEDLSVNWNFITNTYGGYAIQVGSGAGATCSNANVLGNLMPNNSGGLVHVDTSWTNVNQAFNQG